MIIALKNKAKKLSIYTSLYFNFMKLFRKKNIGIKNFDKIEQNQTYYEQIYSHEYPSEKYIPIYNIIIDFINHIKTKHKTILDIGCGVGEFAKQLSYQNSIEYLGFDFSENAIKKAKEKVPDFSNKFFVGNAYNLDDISYDYNIAIAVEVLEHLDDIQIIKQLPSNSYFIATLPNFWANNNAHLRVYKNIFSIYIRFFRYLKILNWKKHRLTKDSFINVVLFKVK